MILQHQGKTVFGSDRSRDQAKHRRNLPGWKPMVLKCLPKMAAASLDPRVDTLVISTAVEPTVPDVAKALERA
jgi:hypothetical protein